MSLKMIIGFTIDNLCTTSIEISKNFRAYTTVQDFRIYTDHTQVNFLLPKLIMLLEHFSLNKSLALTLNI